MRKYLKATVTALLAAALMLPLGIAAAAAEGDSAPAYEILDRGGMFPTRVWGAATTLTENSVTLENSNESDPYQTIIVNVAPDTMILDAVSGEAVDFSAIKENDTLYAWVGPAMTRSLPPMSTATLILCNIPADYGVPSFAEVKSVSERDGKQSAYVTDEVILHMSEDTVYLPAPGSDAAITTLVPGMRVLAWYDVVALSMPAQAGPTKMMIFPSAYRGWVSVDGLTVSLNGQALELTGNNAPKVEDGRLLVPVRAVAEALGCTVSWEPYTNRVAVTGDGFDGYQFVIGDSDVSMGDVTFGLLAPILAEDGVTFFAIDDLIALHELCMVPQQGMPFGG